MEITITQNESFGHLYVGDSSDPYSNLTIREDKVEAFIYASGLSGQFPQVIRNEDAEAVWIVAQNYAIAY
ncbi:MAG: hypothetical protein F6K65_33115 [Moorea sp. SIO3C2]|nr:hypothetical protein [Moorena sp. SIO3C2]